MTVATSPDIMLSYRKFFSIDDFTKSDQERLCFLESIASGEIPLLDDRNASASQTIREWYVKAEKEPQQDAKAKIAQSLLGTDLPHIQNSLENCMMVLYNHRIDSLLENFHEALKIRKGQTRTDRTIRQEAEKLLKIGNDDITNIVNANVEIYNQQLESALDNALAEGRDREIIVTAQTLIDTKVRSLGDYVKEKFAAYSREVRDNIITGKDEAKEVSSTLKYAIEDGRVFSYTKEATPIRKWLIGLGVAATVIAAIAYLAWPSGEPKIAQEQSSYVIQK